jgi:hypothetical protein
VDNGAAKLREISVDGPVRIVFGGTSMSVAAAFLILAAASAAPVATQCPAIPGQTLVYIDIFDGPPENKADLVPDEHPSPATKSGWNGWDLTAGPDGLYVTCGYGKKLVGPYSRMETIRLPDTVKTCRADFTMDRKGNFVTLLRFSCT